MLISIQSAGVAPEVNPRNSMQVRKCASKKSNLTLKPGEDVTRSAKQGYHWHHEKDPLQIFFKKSNLSKI